MKITLFLLSLLAFFQVLTATTIRTKPITRVRRSTDDPSSRILSGTLAQSGQLPYQAGVIVINYNQTNTNALCGGFLISQTAVMTAAHCLYYGNSIDGYDIVLGTLRVLDPESEGYFRVHSQNAKIHENFDYNYGLNNDIALVILPSLVTYSYNIRNILLPRRVNASSTFEGVIARVSGWGVTESSGGNLSQDLLYADVKVIQNLYCELSYGANYVPFTKMCISTYNGTTGACNGDSGGPLAYYDSVEGETIVIGIVSFGATVGCSAGYPEVFTRVSQFLDWTAQNGGPSVRP